MKTNGFNLFGFVQSCAFTGNTRYASFFYYLSIMLKTNNVYDLACLLVII